MGQTRTRIYANFRGFGGDSNALVRMFLIIKRSRLTGKCCQVVTIAEELLQRASVHRPVWHYEHGDDHSVVVRVPSVDEMNLNAVKCGFYLEKCSKLIHGKAENATTTTYFGWKANAVDRMLGAVIFLAVPVELQSY